MPKILKKFEHQEKSRSGFSSKYDWKLYLSGQNVQLTAGEDFPSATEEEEAAYRAEKKSDAQKAGKPIPKDDEISLKHVRKTNFCTTLKARGYDENKIVKITELDDDDLVVTAIAMTEAQIANRKAELERKRAERAATSAANGTQQNAPEAAAAVAPE